MFGALPNAVEALSAIPNVVAAGLSFGFTALAAFAQSTLRALLWTHWKIYCCTWITGIIVRRLGTTGGKGEEKEQFSEISH
jgi:hypothetical protein